ncbi:MAG: hypothetical protein DIU62_000545 [Pseudomonadota bacterium]
MNTNKNRSLLWTGAVCALVLAGCDSIKDVQSGPYTPLPTEREVLKGVIYGLGGGRSITLAYNTNPDDAASFLGAQPSHPTDEPEPLPFTFGSLEVGTQYNVRVVGQPFGKTCTPVSGQTGTIAKGVATNVVIECVSSIDRYDLTVRIPATPEVFAALPEARVILTTGEQMYAKPATEAVLGDDGHLHLVFPKTLYNAAGQPTAFTWSVSAVFTDPEGKEARCQITGATGSNPANNVGSAATGPYVGLSLSQTTSACQFKISGSVAYSAPPGGGTEAGTFPGCDGATLAERMEDPDCLVLEIRDVQAVPKARYAVDGYGLFTFSDENGDPLYFSSTVDAIYDVVVVNHPTGRTCVVGDGGAVSLYRTGTFNPVDITEKAALGAAPNTRAWGTRLNVFCRARPTPEKTLAGTYRPTKWVYTKPGSDPLTVTYDNYDTTKHNSGSSDMLTFFDDGTFLFGTHARVTRAMPEPGVSPTGYSAQVEHGFYDYEDPDGDPSTPDGVIRFTLITDTNPTGAFPDDFGTVPQPLSSGAGRNGTAGLSAMPDPVLTGTPEAGAGIGIWHAVLHSVSKSRFTFGLGVNPDQQLSRITGTFGTAPNVYGTVEWTLTEPQSVDGEFTGSWIARDHRRFWVWDYLTYYGTHVGVVGGAPSMNDACFTMPDVRVSYGVYTRRGSNTGCYPFDRPAPGALFTLGFEQSIDFHLTNITAQTNTFVGVAGLNDFNAQGMIVHVQGSRLVPQFGTTAAATLPGFVGRIPGGNTAADGRSPSPTLFLIAPAGEFAQKVASVYFPETARNASVYFDDLDEVGDFTSWCPTEILGIRTTLNGSPINYPVYFCRNRAAD